MRSGITYVVRTDLPPEGVTRVAVELFTLWMNFALGGEALNGKKLIYPSGRYAASISYRRMGEATVALIADEEMAPEAAILETGHRAFDMKTVTRLSGRALPMHRPLAGPAVAQATGLRRVGTTMRPSMWAYAMRGGGLVEPSAGFASFGPNSPPGSWWIPPMPAYAPALTLAAIGRRLAAAMEGRGG